jgi:hypothetical protein
MAKNGQSRGRSGVLSVPMLHEDELIGIVTDAGELAIKAEANNGAFFAPVRVATQDLAFPILASVC